MTSESNQNSPLQGLEDLQQKLNENTLSRPEKMDAARQVMSHDNYPSEHLLNDVAHLLALNLDQ